MSDLFEYINAASYQKRNLMRGSENDALAEKDYVAWNVNRAFSMHPSSILHANLMNLHHGLPARAQFEFYFYSLPKLNRKAKWPKEEKSSLIEAIQKYYNCSKTVAKQYETLLGEEEKELLLKLYADPVKAKSHK